MKEDFKYKIALSYDTHADIFLKKYNRLDETQIKWLEKFIKLLDDKAKVIDAGCGGGKDSVYLEKKGFEVYSIDLSHRMVTETRNKTKSAEVIRADISNLPFRDESIDGIWCNTTLVHINDKVECLREFRRVLKRNGILYLCIHNILSFWVLKLLFYSLTQGSVWPMKYRDAYWWPTTKNSIKRYLESLNFQILEEGSSFDKWVRFYARKD
jgi:ubiquinone/menaquinone biosynthesis C-methylase UbiE